PCHASTAVTFSGNVKFLSTFYTQCCFHPISAEQGFGHSTRGKRRKNRELQWSQETEETFNHLKQVLANAAFITHFRPDAELAVFVDVFDLGMGVVLQQRRDGKWEPLYFWSTTLN